MSRLNAKAGALLLCVPAILLVSGCALSRMSQCNASAEPTYEAPPVERVSFDLPPNAKPGECYAKVYIPEEFGTRAEQVCVREASERLEVVPAQYEWVEERVCVREASTRLEQVPAEFASRDLRIQTDPGHTGWHVERTAYCVNDLDNRSKLVADQNMRWAEEMYCLRTQEPQYQTVQTQVVVKPPTVREVVIPAEFETVRRQKLVAPATTKHIPIPAEFATVQKTFKVADARVEWRRVPCADIQQADASSDEKATVASYRP